MHHRHEVKSEVENGQKNLKIQPNSLTHKGTHNVRIENNLEISGQPENCFMQFCVEFERVFCVLESAAACSEVFCNF